MFHQLVKENIISVLIRIDSQSRDDNITPDEFAKCAYAIQRLLDKIEVDFGTAFMVNVFKEACEKAGHTIGPHTAGMIQKLTVLGFKVTGINKVCHRK